jgi:polysaccharide export outer membrane protein
VQKSRFSTILLMLAGLTLTVSAQAPKAADQAPKPPASPSQPPSQASPATAVKGVSQAPAAQAPAAKPPAPIAPLVIAPPVTPPPDYVIGPDDVLQVVFWREKDMSSEVTVRPDGMITLPLLNDVQAGGLTPDQLRDKINELSKKFLQEDPTVSVAVKTINSRKVFITGAVTRPGPYLLTAPTTVLQVIAMAGGLTEFADKSKIAVMRQENGKLVRYPFNYKDVAKGKNLEQDIQLKPGDTVIVP